MSVPLEWYEFSDKLKQTGVFRPDRIEPLELWGIYNKKRAFMLCEDTGGIRTIVAFGALWDTEDPEWLEMGTIWVDQNKTGLGLSLQIFYELLRLSGGQSCFLVSKNLKIIGIAGGADWVISKDWQQTPCVNAIAKNRPMGEGRTLCYRSST